MKLEEQDIVRFDNNKEYIIIKIINYQNNKYYYFASLKDDVVPKYVIMKEAKEKGKFTFEKLEDKEFEIIKNKFAFNINE